MIAEVDRRANTCLYIYIYIYIYIYALCKLCALQTDADPFVQSQRKQTVRNRPKLSTDFIRRVGGKAQLSKLGHFHGMVPLARHASQTLWNERQEHPTATNEKRQCTGRTLVVFQNHKPELAILLMCPYAHLTSHRSVNLSRR